MKEKKERLVSLTLCENHNHWRYGPMIAGVTYQVSEETAKQIKTDFPHKVKSTTAPRNKMVTKKRTK